jgi:hypothetical protein
LAAPPEGHRVWCLARSAGDSARHEITHLTHRSTGHPGRQWPDLRHLRHSQQNPATPHQYLNAASPRRSPIEEQELPKRELREIGRTAPLMGVQRGNRGTGGHLGRIGEGERNYPP